MFMVRRLPVCNNRWSLKKISCLCIFCNVSPYIFNVFVKFLNCCMKIVNIRNVICVSFFTIFQQVIAVYVADISEFIKN